MKNFNETYEEVLDTLEFLQTYLEQPKERDLVTFTRLRHVGRLLNWAAGRHREQDLFDISSDLRREMGIWPLEEVSQSSVLDAAKEAYGDIPDLDDIVAKACEQTWMNWESPGHQTDVAEGEAMHLVRKQLRFEGLIPLEDEVAE